MLWFTAALMSITCSAMLHSTSPGLAGIYDVMLAVFLHMSACCMCPAHDGLFPSSEVVLVLVLVLRMRTHRGQQARCSCIRAARPQLQP